MCRTFFILYCSGKASIKELKYTSFTHGRRVGEVSFLAMNSLSPKPKLCQREWSKGICGSSEGTPWIPLLHCNSDMSF